MSRLALFFALLAAAVAAPSPPEAILVVVGDQHSAYERSARFVARVDSLRAAHPGVPVAVLINGDSLEYGNAVARRSSGAVDFAVFAALARRVPVVINLGNHEPEFFDVPETVQRLRAAGLQVISGNLRNPADGKPYASQITYVADRPGHDRRYAIDCTKLQSELGWAPQENFTTGIAKTVDWYLTHRSWAADITAKKYSRERLGHAG